MPWGRSTWSSFASRALSTRAPSWLVTASMRARWSSVMAAPRSAEPAGHIVLGQLVPRIREDLAGLGLLDEVAGAVGAEREEGRPVAHARGLLHVVGHDQDRVVVLQLADQLLD